MNTKDQVTSWWFLSGSNNLHPILVTVEWMRQYPYCEDLFKKNQQGGIAILDSETDPARYWVKSKTLEMIGKGLQDQLGEADMSSLLFDAWNEMAKREGRKYFVSYEFLKKMDHVAIQWQGLFERCWPQWMVSGCGIESFSDTGSL